MDKYNKEQNHGSVDNLLKFVGQRPEKNETTHSKSYYHPLSTTTQRISPKVINLSNIFLTKHEIEILTFELSFTPQHIISELKSDIYNFIRKLRLTYHFRDSTMKTNKLLKTHLNLHQKIMKIKNYKPYAKSCQKQKLIQKILQITDST